MSQVVPDDIEDPLVATRARFVTDVAANALGIRLTEVETGSVTLELDVTEHMINGLGVAHGGYLFLLGDTCFAFVCETLELSSVSRQAEITYIAPGKLFSTLTATGRIVAQYGRNSIVDVSIVDAEGARIAELRVHGVAVRKMPSSG